jgi:hypothetical protein
MGEAVGPNRVVLVRGVYAGYSLWRPGYYDLAISNREFALIRIADKKKYHRLERGAIDCSARMEDLMGFGVLKEKNIIVPHSSLLSLRLYMPPVQPNMSYRKIALFLTHSLPGGKRRRLQITIDRFRDQLEREATATMPSKLPERIMKRNEFLAESAMSFKEILMGILPAEILKIAEWP